jgi:hypothetical protein
MCPSTLPNASPSSAPTFRPVMPLRYSAAARSTSRCGALAELARAPFRLRWNTEGTSGPLPCSIESLRSSPAADEHCGRWSVSSAVRAWPRWALHCWRPPPKEAPGRPHGAVSCVTPSGPQSPTVRCAAPGVVAGAGGGLEGLAVEIEGADGHDGRHRSWSAS